METTHQYTREETHRTIVCHVLKNHDQCLGFCAPAVYANTRPCECGCHITKIVGPKDLV